MNKSLLQNFRGILKKYQWIRHHSGDNSKPPIQVTTKVTKPKAPKTPQGKFDPEVEANLHKKSTEPDAYGPFPDNTNPSTGEIGGPRGPEPTRFGDWERKGRVTDF